ncbi:MAG: hypothetical protein AAGE52_38895 [Myxococcota bacterium]
MARPKKKIVEISTDPPDVSAMAPDEAIAALLEHSQTLAGEITKLREERDVLKKAQAFSALGSANASRS